MKNKYIDILGFLAIVALSVLVVSIRPVNLGLDLKGGVSILLQPEINYALALEYESSAKEIEKTLREKNVKLLDVSPQKDGIRVELLEEGNAVEIVKKDFPRFEITRVEKGVINLTLKEMEVQALREGLISQTVEILRKRIDELGVVQPVITKVGNDRILVELPGMMDIQKAKSVIGRTALLELKLVVEVGQKEELEAKLTRDTELLPSLDEKDWFLVEKVPIITGAGIKNAYTSQDEFGQPSVSFELNDEASEAFGKATQENIGRALAIVLDKKVVSAPVIRSRITDRGQITGRFTLEEAKELAIVLKSGALPTRVDFLQESVIGPSLGRDAIEQGIRAGILGYVLLSIVLLGRYKMVGVSANLSILMNGLLLWAGLVLLGGTLTLPGIAGIILNMGIAVDSNVLIFERVKEELRLGNTPRKAIELGYRRALSAVWDTHITLLVAALILFQFGSGPVKGFATTLTIGTIASFISNVYYAKVFLDLQSKMKLLKL